MFFKEFSRKKPCRIMEDLDMSAISSQRSVEDHRTEVNQGSMYDQNTNPTDGLQRINASSVHYQIEENNNRIVYLMDQSLARSVARAEAKEEARLEERREDQERLRMQFLKQEEDYNNFKREMIERRSSKVSSRNGSPTASIKDSKEIIPISPIRTDNSYISKTAIYNEQIESAEPSTLSEKQVTSEHVNIDIGNTVIVNYNENIVSIPAIVSLLQDDVFANVFVSIEQTTMVSEVSIITQVNDIAVQLPEVIQESAVIKNTNESVVFEDVVMSIIKKSIVSTSSMEYFKYVDYNMHCRSNIYSYDESDVDYSQDDNDSHNIQFRRYWSPCVIIKLDKNHETIVVSDSSYRKDDDAYFEYSLPYSLGTYESSVESSTSISSIDANRVVI